MRKRRKTRKRRGRLSLAQVESGIYLDFEGWTGQHPILLGMMVAQGTGEQDVEQYVVSPTFAEAARGISLEHVSLESLLNDIVAKAEHEKRYIIAWSEHDLNVVRDHCDRALASRFAGRYRNARAFCKQWLKDLHADLAFDATDRKKNALANYMDLVGYQVPPDFGPARTGDNLRALKGPLSAGKQWDALSDRQRGYWLEVLGHNRHDCIGMYRVCRKAATERAAAGQAVRRNMGAEGELLRLE